MFLLYIMLMQFLHDFVMFNSFVSCCLQNMEGRAIRVNVAEERPRLGGF